MFGAYKLALEFQDSGLECTENIRKRPLKISIGLCRVVGIEHLHVTYILHIEMKSKPIYAMLLICSLLTIFASHFWDHNLRESKNQQQQQQHKINSILPFYIKSIIFFLLSFGYKYVHLLVHVQFICLINKNTVTSINYFFFCFGGFACGISRMIPAKKYQKCFLLAVGWKYVQAKKIKKEEKKPTNWSTFSTVKHTIFGWMECVWIFRLRTSHGCVYHCILC